MKILSLQAEAFKRLKVVEIRPDGALVQVSGKNRQGKSSTLDAIWAALGGGRALPVEPIHHGAEKARIRLEIGEEAPEFIVTRTFTRKEGGDFTTALKVETAEGAKFGNGQEVLNGFLGALTFDPLEFTRLKDEDRLAMLRPLAPGVDFDALAAANAEDFAERTNVNRDAKAKRTQVDGIALPPGAVPAPVDVAALEEELAGAAQFNGDIENRKANRAAAIRERDKLDEEIVEARNRLAAMEERSAALTEKLAGAEELPALKDILAIREKLQGARATNEHAAKARTRADLTAEAIDLEAKSAALTKAMEARDNEMAGAVAKAVGAVQGLGFAGGLITLNGAPFDQASDAEQLEASIHIAALMNPRLKVVRVRDGSRLDAEALAAVATFAEKNGLQVWVETVANERGAGFVLEDGELAGPGTHPAPRVEDHIDRAVALNIADAKRVGEEPEEAV